MDAWEHEGRDFSVVMVSDVIRDGMGLELTDLGSSESGPVLETFWHDDRSGFDPIIHHSGTLPISGVERFGQAPAVSSTPGTGPGHRR